MYFCQWFCVLINGALNNSCTAMKTLIKREYLKTNDACFCYNILIIATVLGGSIITNGLHLICLNKIRRTLVMSSLTSCICSLSRVASCLTVVISLVTLRQCRNNGLEHNNSQKDTKTRTQTHMRAYTHTYVQIQKPHILWYILDDLITELLQ